VPLSPAVFVADHLRPAAIKAGVRIEPGQRFGLHNLRHSLSSWLVNKAKVEPKTVQSILRHSRIQTTLDLYTHGDGHETKAAQRRVPQGNGTRDGGDPVTHFCLWVGLWVGVSGQNLRNLRKTNAGRYRIRTYDFHRVNLSRSRSLTT
jgi:hypothetical protein